MHYSIVMINRDGGIISRPAGSNLEAATAQAISRRADFPHAKEIRVVSSTGIISHH
jgi:hypothetical protein